MLNVQVHISGISENIKRLESLSSKLVNFSEAMKEIGDEMTRYYGGQAFASQGGVFGANWAPLAQSTIRSKVRKYRFGGTTPLVASGAMRDSFVASASANSVTVTNSAPYFVYHQSSAPRHHLPRRQMIGVNSDITSIVQQVIEADIAQKIGKL